MATQVEPLNLAVSGKVEVVSSFKVSRFDYIISLASAWMVMGLFIDGWAHLHILNIETFFTPWHGIMYSGFCLLGGTLVFTAISNRKRGLSWKESVPNAYWPSLLAVPIFIFGGIGDMIGHTLLGVEVGVEALLSPTHLILFMSGIMLVSGPFRAAWRKPGRGWITLLPMLTSLMLTYSLITFVTQYGHPLYNVWSVVGNDPNVWIHQSLGVTGIVVQSIFLTSALFMLVRRWSPPRGAFVFIIGLNTILITFMYEHLNLAISGVLAGIASELLWWWLHPTMQKTGVMRLFLAAVPFIYYLFYFIALQLTIGVMWSKYLWSGSLVLAGVIMFAFSFILIPPTLPSTIDNMN